MRCGGGGKEGLGWGASLSSCSTKGLSTVEMQGRLQMLRVPGRASEWVRVSETSERVTR